MRRTVAFVSVVCGLAMVGCGSSEPQFQGVGARAEAAHAGAGHAGTAPAGDGNAADCEPETVAQGTPAPTPAPSGPRPIRVADDGSQVFGAELGDAPAVALSEITAAPERYAGQVVRTDGTIERVCQRMGCWMELRGENAPAVRVPMAGHAFFLPRDVTGRSATIEGRVGLTPLSAARRAHLEAEGALATASALSIEATSVVVR